MPRLSYHVLRSIQSQADHSWYEPCIFLCIILVHILPSQSAQLMRSIWLQVAALEPAVCEGFLELLMDMAGTCNLR